MKRSTKKKAAPKRTPTKNYFYPCCLCKNRHSAKQDCPEVSRRPSERDLLVRDRDEAQLALEVLGWNSAKKTKPIDAVRVISVDGDIYNAVYVDGDWWSLDGNTFEALFWKKP